MPTVDAVADLALSLPEVEQGTYWRERAWKVRGKAFAWVRPLREADREALGDDAPTGDVLGVVVDDLGHKQAVLDTGTAGVFTTPHFDGHAVLLLALDDVSEATLRDRLEDAWLARAPASLVTQHRDQKD